LIQGTLQNALPTFSRPIPLLFPPSNILQVHISIPSFFELNFSLTKICIFPSCLIRPSGHLSHFTRIINSAWTSPARPCFSSSHAPFLPSAQSWLVTSFPPQPSRWLVLRFLALRLFSPLLTVYLNPWSSTRGSLFFDAETIRHPDFTPKCSLNITQIQLPFTLLGLLHLSHPCSWS